MAEEMEKPQCVYCGADADLVADAHIEGLWYCRPCLTRREEHQFLVEEGCDGDDPSYE